MDENLKPKKKILPMIIIGIVAVALVAGATVACVWANKPENVFKRSLKKSMKLLAKSEFGEFAEETANGGSVQLSFDLKDFIAVQDPSMRDTLAQADYKGSIKAYFNAEGKKEAGQIKISDGDKKIVDAILAADESRIILKETEILKDAYKLKYENFAEDFKKSIFADENSEYYLGIDEEVIDTIDGFINDNKDLKKLSDKATESAVEILCDAIENNLTVEKEKGEIELGDDDLKVKEIVIKGNGKKLVSAAKEFLKAIKADDDVKALVKKIDSAYQEGFKDQFSDAISTAINQIDSMSNSDKDVAAKAKFELLFKISKKNGSLIGFSATIEDANDTKQSCEFFVGPDIKNPDEIRFSLNDGHDTYEVRYLASENTSSELEAKISYRENSERTELAKIDWDKKSGDFDVELNIDEMDVKAHLNVKKTDKKLEISGKGSYVEADGEKIKLDGFELIVNKNDKMPDIETDAKDVLNIKADELEKIQENISEFVEKLYPEEMF